MTSPALPPGTYSFVGTLLAPDGTSMQFQAQLNLSAVPNTSLTEWGFDLTGIPSSPQVMVGQSLTIPLGARNAQGLVTIPDSAWSITNPAPTVWKLQVVNGKAVFTALSASAAVTVFDAAHPAGIP